MSATAGMSETSALELRYRSSARRSACVGKHTSSWVRAPAGSEAMGPRRITIASVFRALPTFGQSAAIVAIAAETSNKTGPGRTGSTRALPQARAA
jgi:hypothetical protein